VVLGSKEIKMKHAKALTSLDEDAGSEEAEMIAVCDRDSDFLFFLFLSFFLFFFFFLADL
jgi:hypothetical protein